MYVGKAFYGLPIVGVVLFGILITGSIVEALNTNSVQIDGTNQYLSVSDSSSLSVTDDITLETWVKFASLPNEGELMTLVSKFPETERSYSLAQFNQGGTQTLFFTTSENGGNPNTDSYVTWTPLVETWYHVAVVWSDSNNESIFYVNGLQQGAIQPHSSDGIYDGVAPLNLGKQNDDTPRYLDGSIDDARVWNTARTPAQINQNFSIELTGSEPGLVGYWNFNNGSLEDLTANNNDLTAPNSFTSSTDVPFDSAPSPTLTLTATPSTITTGGSSTLSWTSTDATSCTASNGWSGAKATSSSEIVSPSVTTTYTLDCSGPGGSIQKDATVTVNPLPAKVRKSADESVTSNTTLQNDDRLAVGLEAGKTYLVQGVLFVRSVNATPDLKLAFDVPSGSDMSIGYVSAENNANEEVLSVDGAASARIQVSANDTTQVTVHGTVVAGTSGNLQVQWSQFTANTNAVTMKKGSYLKVEEL